MKKANAAATILVVLLLLIGGIVITYKPLFRQERGIDYNREFATARNLLDRVTYDAQQALMSNGFRAPENMTALYCNEPELPSLELVEKEFEAQFKDKYNLTDEEHGVNMTITLNHITLGEELSMNDLQIAIASTKETRTIKEDATYDISGFYLAYTTVKAWLACDAGNFMQGFLDLHANKECSYAVCTCGDENLNYDSFKAQAASDGAITETELLALLQSSTNKLDYLFTGGTCESAGALPPPYTCEIDTYRGDIDITNTIGSHYLQNGFQCAHELNEMYGYDNERTYYKGQAYDVTCPTTNNPELPDNNNLEPASPLPTIPDDEPSIGPAQASDLFANFFFVNQDLTMNMPIRCISNTGQPYIKFHFQISIKTRCATDPPLEQGSGLSCLQPGGGECPPGEKCGICGICDEYGSCNQPDPDTSRECIISDGDPDNLCAIKKCDGSHYDSSACTIATTRTNDGLPCEDHQSSCYNLYCQAGTCSNRIDMTQGETCGTTECNEKTCKGPIGALTCIETKPIEDYENTECGSADDNPCQKSYCAMDGSCSNIKDLDDGTECGVDEDNECIQLTCQAGVCEGEQAFADQTECTPPTGDDECVNHYCDGFACTQEEPKPQGTQCGIKDGCTYYECDGNGACKQILDDSLCGEGECGGTCQEDGTCELPVGESCTPESECEDLAGECNDQGRCETEQICCTEGFTPPAACDQGYCCVATGECMSPEECEIWGENES